MIDHSSHNHPATPAARKACRAALKATPAVPQVMRAQVGKGKMVHFIENGFETVRCGAGVGRGSSVTRLGVGPLTDVTCSGCRNGFGQAHH